MSQPDRPVSFQTEDRYWTDYLRVILPVVGLLLLLGLFWFWASSLIGDDGGAPATPSQQAIIVTPDAPTPTATTEAEISPDETVDTGEGSGEGEGEQPAEPTPTTEEEAPPSTGGTFEIEDLVAVTEDNVNMRADPSLDGEVVEQLSVGDELRITGPSEEADDYIWWPVEDEATGASGWMVEEFLEPAG